MDTMAEAAERSKQLQILYNKYSDFFILFGQIRSKSALISLNAAGDAYLKLLKATKQEVNSRKK